MSLIQKQVSDFTVQAYQNGEFKTVTKDDIMGKWSVFFFYPADFTFVCPTELEDLANKYDEFNQSAAKSILFQQTLISYTRLGMMHQRESRRFSILCLQILHMYFARILMCLLKQMDLQREEHL